MATVMQAERERREAEQDMRVEEDDDLQAFLLLGDVCRGRHAVAKLYRGGGEVLTMARVSEGRKQKTRMSAFAP